MALELSPSSGRKSPLEFVKEDVSNKYGSFFQEYTVLSEYCQLLQQPVPGVYVLTSKVSPLIWYGLLLVKSGIYEGGIFKFILSIPTHYPDGGSPRIDFMSGVYHPQINYDTGELTTKRQFPRWRRDVNCIRDILNYARNIFYTVDCESPYNEEASLLYANDKLEFKERVKKCIKECHSLIMESPDESDPHAIHIGQWHHEVMKSAREHIFEPEYKTETVHTHSGLPKGLSWVKTGTYKPFTSD